MRVFVTGASGHIGSAVLPELLGSGHEVVGLARSDASAAMLTAAGAQVMRGDLDDLDALREATTAADGVVHLAFKHDADRDDAVADDLLAVSTIGDALEGTDKPFVGTSWTLMLVFAGLNRVGTETDVVETGPRIDAENAVIAMSARRVRSSVIRLPPTVHSSLDRHGFIPTLISIARDNGVASYVGDGSNRWPAGHTLDVARLYRLALETAPAGTRLHAVGDEGIPFRQIAEAIAQNLDVPVTTISPEDADAYFGFLSLLVQLDNPTSSALTQEILDWHPVHPGLIDDIDEGHYFKD